MTILSQMTTAQQAEFLAAVDAAGGQTKAGLIASLAGQAIYPSRRRLNKVAPSGDSRHEDTYLNPTQTAYGCRSGLVNAKALSGQKIIIGAGYGKSGDRTDQTYARMLGLLPPPNANLPNGDPRTTDAGIVHMQCGANDIAQVATGTTFVHAVTGETVTIGTVATVAARNLRDMGRLFVAAGMEYVLENEYGTTSSINTTEKLKALMDLRAMITEMGETERSFTIHDLFGIITNPLFSTTAVQLIQTYVYDGTHRNGRGGYYHGKSLNLNVFDKLIPTNSRGLLLPPRNIAEATASRRQLLLNPLLTTTTGGSLASGFTGTVPANYVTAAIGGATAVFGTEVEPNGYGNRTTVAATFNASGDAVRYNQALSGNGAGAYNAQLQAGDIVQAVALVNITAAPVNLMALELSLINGIGGGVTGTAAYDMGGPSSYGANDQGINEVCTLTLATRPFVLGTPTGTFPFLTAEIKATGMGAGSCTYNVQMGLRRRESVY